jgi:hypothetical protein
MVWKGYISGPFTATLILFTASSSFAESLEIMMIFAPLLKNVRAARRPEPLGVSLSRIA